VRIGHLEAQGKGNIKLGLREICCDNIDGVS